ncbi:DsbA family protein [Candidatus Woesearchaeota archaeon]|nr:DsbA family protein [Candidatus Woesearchaeota archaeon]
MAICVIALVVFSVLGIFSASHRKIAKEAFDCVFRRLTLRKCETGLDKRLKSQITGSLMLKAPRVAKFTYKNFEVLSWILTILLIASLGYSTFGAYNFVRYGNCNGDSDEFCIFDALIPEGESEAISACGTVEPNLDNLIVPQIGDSHTIGPEDAKVIIIEFGCYSCPFSREAQPVVEQVLEEYKDEVLFVFKHFPIMTHNDSLQAAIASECADEQGFFWDYHTILFENDNHSKEALIEHAGLIEGLDVAQFSLCLAVQEYVDVVNTEIDEGKASNIYGTPTFFINGEPLVGPKTFRQFKRVINRELK